MSFMKNISLGLLMLLVICDVSSADVRICGKSLTQFLEVICVDGFNTKNLKAKKSVPLIQPNENDIAANIQPMGISSLFLNDLYTNENSLMAKTRRRRFDGVADECCRKACSMPELLSYCI